MITMKRVFVLFHLTVAALLVACAGAQRVGGNGGKLTCDGDGAHVANGQCYESLEAACEALACGDGQECRALETDPPQAECSDAVEPTACDGEGAHLANGQCYESLEAACAALSCEDGQECISMETDPPQAGCVDSDPGPDPDDDE